MDTIEDSPGAQLTLFRSKETANQTGIVATPNLIDIDSLNPELPFHKIFLYQETTRNGGANDYFVRSNVTLWRAGTPSIILPSSVGQDIGNTLLAETIVSMFPVIAISNNTNVFVPTATAQETITAILSKSFVGGANSVILGFARAVGVIDRVTYSVESFGVQAGAAIVASRAVLGIFSSVNQF